MGKGSPRFRIIKRRRGRGAASGTKPRSLVDGTVARKADPGQPQGLRRRLEACGIRVAPDATPRQVIELAEAAGLRTVSADHPLDLLFNRGFLVSPAEVDQFTLHERARGVVELATERYEAGQRYQALAWRVFGNGTAHAQDNGYRTPLNAEDYAEAVRRERRDARFGPMDPEERQAHADDRLADAESELRTMEDRLRRCGRYVQTVVHAAALFVCMPRLGDLNDLRRGLDALASA